MNMLEHLLGWVRQRLPLHDPIEVHEGASGRTAALGDLTEMLEVMEDQAASYRQQGEKEALGDVLAHISKMKLDLLGDVDGAIADLEERRAAYVAIGEITGECDCLYALCSIRAERGEQEEASQLWLALSDRAGASGDDELVEATQQLRGELDGAGIE